MTTQAVEIRRQTPDDWRVVKRVRLAALREAPSAFGSSHEHERVLTAAQWRSWIGTEGIGEGKAIFVAYDGTEAVGMVGAFHETKASVMLIAMWVAPGARGSGIGRRLAQTVLDWAVEVGARTVTLWVADDNLAAIALYVATGFTPTGKGRPSRRAADRQISEFARPLR
jgi:RimJ/RimL family protein N-acetyltransferase